MFDHKIRLGTMLIGLLMVVSFVAYANATNFCVDAPSEPQNALIKNAHTAEAAGGATIGKKPAASLEPKGTDQQKISWPELCEKATAQYRGDGLSVFMDQDGARLNCAFQKLEGKLTAQGLRVFSTAPSGRGSFALRVTNLGRAGHEVSPPLSSGRVVVEDGRAKLVRSQLVEELTVSVDGIRQDFILPKQPVGTGELRLELALENAEAKTSDTGLRLVMADSGRVLSYSRLQVTDANGRQLASRFDLASPSRLMLVVEDSGALYPVRIDPTITDANWVSMGQFPGMNNPVRALATDAAGNLYAGGDFTTAGGVTANRIAKWDGSSWSALGSGMNGSVNALTTDAAGNLYAGGEFVIAGGKVSCYCALCCLNFIPYTINASAGSGGVISPAGIVIVAEGSNQTFTITPNPGYRVEDIKVDGSSQGKLASYTFSNITANHTIAASFLKVRALPWLGLLLDE